MSKAYDHALIAVRNMSPQDNYPEAERLSSLGRPIVLRPIKRISDPTRALENIMVFTTLLIACLSVIWFALMVVSPAVHHILFWIFNIITGKHVMP